MYPEDKQKITGLIAKLGILTYLDIRINSKVQNFKRMSYDNILVGHAEFRCMLKYIHFFGNESNENLLEAYGIVTEANKGNILSLIVSDQNNVLIVNSPIFLIVNSAASVGWFLIMMHMKRH